MPSLTLASEQRSTNPSDVASVAARKAEAEKFKTQGNDYLAAKEAMKAVESYTKAIELDPENAVYYSNRAAAFSLQEDWSSAIEDGMAAISLNPRYAKGYSRLGAAYIGVGNMDKAAESYAKALELEPENEQYKKALEQTRRGRKPSQQAPTGGMPNMPPMGGMDFASLMNNPELMSMASRMMQDPNAMANLMNNPNIAAMMQGMGINPRRSPAGRSPPPAAEEED